MGKNKTKLEKIRRNEEYALKYKKRKKKSSAARSRAPEAPSLGGVGRFSSRPDYPAICSACSTATTLPFEPTNGKPVYCRPCFTQLRA